jgi:fibronectin-binding autotransporter adhesin
MFKRCKKYQWAATNVDAADLLVGIRESEGETMKVRSRIACISAAVAALMYGGSSVQARDLIWDANGTTAPLGADGSGSWDDNSSSNWVDGDLLTGTNTVWLSSNPDSALFGNLTSTYVGAITPNNIDLAAPITAQNVTFGTAADGGIYNISDFGGGSLTINGNVTKASGGGQSQFLLVSGPLMLAAGDHVVAMKDSPGDVAELSINGSIAGAGGLTVDNTAASTEAWGTVALNVDNSYAGATNINKGRLVITTSGGLGSAAAGTTISNQGALSIGGAGSTVVGGLTIAEPITITRNTYSGGEFGRYTAALIANNNGGFQTHTISGPFVVDSADARVQSNTNNLVISSDITEGGTVTPGTGVLTVDGDFAGFVTLTGNNTGIGTGGIKLIGGVELNVSNENNLGGPSSKLTFAGSATLHPVGGFMTSFGTHVINNTTFSGGLDVDSGQTFTVDQNLGDAVTAVGTIGKRGLGTLNLNSTINLRGGQTFWDAGVVNVNGSTTLHSLHLRSPTVNIGTGGSVTMVSNFQSFGQDSTGTNGGPDKAIVNITGSGQLIQTATGDFNVSDNANTEGTINLSDNGVLTTNGLMHVAKSAGGKGTINQSGGTFTLNRNGNFTLVLGSRNGLGTYNLSGGTMTSAGEFYVGQGGSGVGVFNMTGGTVNQNNWFVVGREGGGGTVDFSGGVFNKAGGGSTEIDTQGGLPSSMTIRNAAQYNALTGDFRVGLNNGTLLVKDSGKIIVSGGEFWVGQGGGSTGVATLQDNASVAVNNNWIAIGRGGGTGTLNLTGNATLTKAGGGNLTIGSGGGSTGTLNQTGGTLTNTGSETYIAEGGTAGTWNLSGGTVNAALFDVGHTGGGSATLNVSGTAAMTATTVRIGEANSVSGTLNLDGGSITANQVIGRNSTGTKTVNFNGGTLRARADNTAFLEGLSAANVKNGGAIIDSNGHTVTIGQALIANGTGGVTKNGLGAVTLGGNNTYTGGTTVNAGTLNLARTSRTSSSLVVADTAKATMTPRTAGVKVLQVGTLNLNSTGTLDLNDNDLVVTTGNFATLQGLVFAGYRSGPDTTATGIVSTTSQTVHGGTTILALFDNSLAGFGDWPAGSGQTIAGNAIVGKYTYIGDTNMDGQVTAQDYTATDSNLGTSVDLAISWFYGDTNFDGNIDPTDYAGIDGALGLGQGSPLAAQGLSAVPEPGSLTVIAAGLAGLLRRRRRAR